MTHPYTWPHSALIYLASILFFFLSTLSYVDQAQAAQKGLLVAVASNFKPTAEKLLKVFDQQHGTKSRISSASTGTLFQQITLGAPFDVFLAADSNHVDQLVNQGFTTQANTKDYAVGKLILLLADERTQPHMPTVAPTRTQVSNAIQASLATKGTKLAMPNPRLAPYGLAAQQVLQGLAIPEQIKDHIVLSNNVALSLQYFRLGNSNAAFCAASLLSDTTRLPNHSVTTIPPTWHQPLLQRSAIINASAQNDLARQFLDFLSSNQGKHLIVQNGYDIPPSVNLKANN